MIRILFIFLLASCYFKVVAQNGSIQEICVSLDAIAYPADTAKLIELAEKTKYIIEKGQLELTLGELYGCWGKFYENNFQHDSANHYFTLKVQYYENKNDSLKLADAYYDLAGSYIDADEYVFSAEIYQKSIQLYEKMPEQTTKLGKAYNALANNYYYSGDSKIAIGLYVKAIDILKSKSGNERELSMAYGNIAAMHQAIELYEVSENYYFKAIDVIEGLDHTRELIGAYLGLGIVKEEQKAFEEAFHYYSEAYRLSMETNDQIQIGFSLQSFGYYYLALQVYDSAIYYGQMAIEFADKINNTILKLSGYEILHEAYFNQGKFKEAYEYLNTVRTETDSLYDLNTARQLNTIQTQFDTEKKEAELARQQQLIEQTENKIARQNLFRNFLFGVLMLFVAIIALIYRNQQIQRKANLVLQQKNDEISSQRDHIELLEQTKNRWFINISHELKTPLTLIKGPIDQLKAKSGLNEADHKKLNLAGRNLKVLDELIHEILNLSNFESGEIKLNNSVFDLVAHLQGIVDSYEMHAMVNEMKVLLENPLGEPIYIHADEAKMSKLFTNLLSNAIKFSSMGDTVKLLITENSNQIIVRVADTGKGIPAEDLPYIFDRFYQVADPSYNASGSGIGLAICKEVVKLHGGEILVESEPAKGSTFEVMLPISLKARGEQLLTIKHHPTVEKKPIQNNSIPKENTKKRSKKKQILLVDDNPDMLEFIDSILDDQYLLLQAMDGKEAINYLENSQVDLVIADIMMPRMDGNELSRIMKENESWKNIPYITVSAIGNEEQRQKHLRIGVDDYLIKPFDPLELIARLENLLTKADERMKSDLMANNQSIAGDQEFIDQLTHVVHSQISDKTFNELRLAEAMAMSEKQLYRQLKSTTGLSPEGFIKEVRLLKAMELVKSMIFNHIDELSAAVGFQKSNEFIACFEKRFGQNPIDLIKTSL